MSQINGDKARFQKNRKRKLRVRERIRAMVAKLQAAPAASAPSGKAKRAKS
jgi:hypothetical protein